MVKRGFGELESEILAILKAGERKTVKDVHLALGGKDNYNTVMTVMSRLAEKNLLGRERVGLQYEYWIVKEHSPVSILDKLKYKLFGIKTSTLVCHLIESAEDLTDEDLAGMEELVHKIRLAKK